MANLELKNVFINSQISSRNIFLLFLIHAKKLLLNVSKVSSLFWKGKNWKRELKKKRESQRQRQTERESKQAIHFLFYKVNILITHICRKMCACVRVFLFLSFLCHTYLHTLTLTHTHTHTHLKFRSVSLGGDKHQTCAQICEYSRPLQQLQLYWNEIISFNQLLHLAYVIWSSKNFLTKQYDDNDQSRVT